jgi:KilA-N domain
MIDTTAKLRYTLPATETSVVGFRSLLVSAAKAATALKHCGFFVHTYLLGWGGREGASPAGYVRVPPAFEPVHPARLCFEAMAWFKPQRNDGMTHTITLNNTAIRLNDGLYSLNDLHKAAGGERKHLPAEFLRIDQTKDLILELAKYGDSHISTKTVRGCNGGTYGCKELVYAYAMWISAAFTLTVIRAFDAMQAPALVQTPTVTINETCERWAQQLLHGNSYPVQIFMPLWQAINHRLAGNHARLISFANNQ